MCLAHRACPCFLRSVQNLPYLVCNCVLLPPNEEQEDSNRSIDYTSPSAPPSAPSAAARSTSGNSSGQLAMLCGTRVYSAIEANDTDGERGLFFIFWDVSVRQTGNYRMRFSMVEA